MGELPILDRPLTERPEASFTLSSEFYLSPQIFEHEKRQIFYKTWQYVAPVGLLANEGIKVITPVKIYWWLILFPSLALGVTLLALNFLGDGLRDALDPRLRDE